MPTLVVVAYPDETSAATAGEQVQRLVRHLRVEPDAVAVLRRDRDGRFHLTTNHRPVAGEPGWGMVWMLAFALLFAPRPDRPDQPAGAGLDGLLELVATGGIEQRFRTWIRDRLAPGTSALLLAVEGEQADRVAAVLGPYGGEVLPAAVTTRRPAALHEALHRAAVSALALSAGRDPARGTG